LLFHKDYVEMFMFWQFTMVGKWLYYRGLECSVSQILGKWKRKINWVLF